MAIHKRRYVAPKAKAKGPRVIKPRSPGANPLKAKPKARRPRRRLKHQSGH